MQSEFTPEPTVSIVVIRRMLQALEPAGVVPQQLLRAARFDPALLEADDARVPRSMAYKLGECAVGLSGDPAFGLHWSERMTQGTFAPVSHLMAHSATVRQALESLAQFGRLHSDQASVELVEHDNLATMRMRPLSGQPLVVQRLTSEMVVHGFFRGFRQSSRNLHIETVSFEYPAPSYHREYVRLFQGEVLFEQAFTGLVFERAFLDAPTQLDDGDVHRALWALAERRLLRMTQGAPYAVQVCEFLVRKRGGNRASMNAVARALRLSVRSLRRRLAAEGKSYNEISNEALGIVAKHLLRDKQRSIQETAYDMGFESISSFHRAFRRWTGTTPNTFRDSIAHDEAV